MSLGWALRCDLSASYFCCQCLSCRFEYLALWKHMPNYFRSGVLKAGGKTAIGSGPYYDKKIYGGEMEEREANGSCAMER